MRPRCGVRYAGRLRTVGCNSFADVIKQVAQWKYKPYLFEQGRLQPFPACTPVNLPQVFDLLLLVPERHPALLDRIA